LSSSSAVPAKPSLSSNVSASCTWAQPLIEAQSRAQSSRSALERLRVYKEIDRLRPQIASSAFDAYLRGGLSEEFSKNCLSMIDDREDFLQLIDHAFLDRSLKWLQSSKVPRLQALARAAGTGFGFRLTGDDFSPPPTDFKAGFHRESKAIFMDITRTEPGEWFVILSHELVHRLDSKIPGAIAEYSKVDIAMRLIAKAQTTTRPVDLSPVEREDFKNWIHAGMERGLLAEARAWAITLLIYEDGLRAGLWQRIDWLDEVLVDRRAEESWERYALRLMTTRSHQPREGAFAYTLTLNLLEEVKREVLEGKRPFEFGELAEFLK
jgi:hypothetical protein